MLLDISGYADEEAPALLVRAERAAAAQRDAAALALLWSDDARIVETRGTEDTTDDYTWQGRDAVLDRYRVAVFPSPPSPLPETPLPAPEFAGDRATLTHGADEWEFVRRDGRWWIAGLVIDPER